MEHILRHEGGEIWANFQVKLDPYENGILSDSDNIHYEGIKW
jgi:hypothetical protein